MAKPEPPPAPLTVSDHALIRWLERVRGVDFTGLRWELAALLEPKFAGLPNQAVVIDGFRYVIRDGVVTTILSADEPWMGAHGRPHR